MPLTGLLPGCSALSWTRCWPLRLVMLHRPCLRKRRILRWLLHRRTELPKLPNL